MVFDSLKCHVFSYIITRYAFVLRSLSKKFINGCRISIVSVTPKKAEMAPFWEKRGILHLSYLLNESGDPNYFFFFYYFYIMKFNPGKFEEIFISRTITDELP